MDTFPQLGTLFYGGRAQYRDTIEWTQPGGPGTTVYPQQKFGEQVALFVAGCGHWFNHWNVEKNNFNPPSYDVNFTEISAFMLCPLCGYVQRIITPYDEIYDSVSNYILLA